MIRRLLALVSLACPVAFPALSPGGEEAADLLRESKVAGGLCVCLPCTGGLREADLAATGQLVVHALATDQATLVAARKNLRLRGLYGVASVRMLGDRTALPYARDIVNLLIADLDALGDKAPSREELLRVVAPRGAAMLKQGGRWQRVAKPVPAEVDTWPQWDHDATGNPSSSDRRVGPTTSLRWLAGTTTVYHAGNKVGLRIADGRLLYVNIDYAPDRYWSRQRGRNGDIVARDAFNGTLLWRRAIDGVPGGGDQPPRFALTADADRVYCFPDDRGPLHALDAATGKTLVTFKDAPALPGVADWDKWKDPVSKIHFLVRVFDGKVLQTLGEEACCSDAKTGKRIWRHVTDDHRPIGWAVAGGGKVFLAVGGGELVKNRASQATALGTLVALDAATGKVLWKNDTLTGRALFRMIYYRDSLIVPTFPADGKKDLNRNRTTVTRLAAADGKTVWHVANRKFQARGHYFIVLARGEEVVVGQQSGFALDFRTGKLLATYNWGQSDNSCADLKSTPAYTMYGLTFIDRDGKRITRGQTRSICDVGNFPAYGLLYGSPLACLCAEYLNGYNALSSEDVLEPTPRDDRRVAETVADPATAPPTVWPGKDEWPMYLAGPRRGAATPTPVEAEPKLLWRVKLADWPEAAIADDWRKDERTVGLLSAPTVAAGKVFVTQPHSHQVLAMDAATGKRAWSFTAGARIDSPPTIYPGGKEKLCLFGCRDGWVYCLRARDGALVWKFLAGRCDRLVGVQSQLESPWPVHGSIMIDRGHAIVTAGRQSALDGGIHVWKLRPHDGSVVWSSRLWTDPDAAAKATDKSLITSKTRNRRTNDLLVHNGREVCLWITKLKDAYRPGELVDIESSVIQARALKFAVASRDQLRERKEARWIWSASSNGLLSRRIHSVGRYDERGVNYADLNAVKICLAGKSLYALDARKSRGFHGSLVRVDLDADGQVPDQPAWKGKRPNGANDAMIVADRRIYISYYRAGDKGGSALHVYSTADGKPVGSIPLPARVIKDGVAAAYGRLYAALVGGSLVCLGDLLDR